MEPAYIHAKVNLRLCLASCRALSFLGDIDQLSMLKHTLHVYEGETKYDTP